MLLQIVPIGRLDGTAPRPEAGIAAARLVGALLAGRRIMVDEDTFGLEVGKFLVARIAQEQRLAPVADENDAGESGFWSLDPRLSHAREKVAGFLNETSKGLHMIAKSRSCTRSTTPGRGGAPIGL
jgi:hypothetical protein